MDEVKSTFTREFIRAEAKKRREDFANWMAVPGGPLGESQVEELARSLARTDFFSAPASTKYHGNYPGGLYDHSLAVMKNLLTLTDKLGLKWILKRSPYIVGMFHDLCKIGMYVYNKTEGKYEYNDGMVLPGHGDRSVIIAQQLGLDLTTEEIMCIRWHMGAFDDKAMWDYYGRAIEHNPNVLWTHTADMMASRIDKV